jgi:hemerythrin superfamily protein
LLGYAGMDAINLLKQDHREVEALFKRFERAGDDAHAQKKNIAEQIIKQLSIHAGVEEELFYPAARELSEDLQELVLESLEEHHVAKATLLELDKMSVKDERFDAKMTVLMENIRHHIKEEEGELFPKLREVMSRAQLEALAAAIKQAKRAAPTHPHPMAPDTPPGNFISDALAKVLDTGKDLMRGAARSAKSMVNGRTAARARRSNRKQRRGRRS